MINKQIKKRKDITIDLLRLSMADSNSEVFELYISKSINQISIPRVK